MKLVQLFIPLYDNDGMPFKDDLFVSLKEQLAEKFGGVTIYRQTTGFWKQSEGPAQKDEILIYEVMVKTIETKFWKELKERLLKAFRQESLLFRFFDIELL